MRSKTKSSRAIAKSFFPSRIEGAVALVVAVFFFSLTAHAGCEIHSQVVGCGGIVTCPDGLSAVDGNCTFFGSCLDEGTAQVVNGTLVCPGKEYPAPLGPGTVQAEANCCTVSSGSADSHPSGDPQLVNPNMPKAPEGPATHQEAAQLEVSSLLGGVASNSLTVAGVECLQGANVALGNVAAAGQLVAGCQKGIDRGLSAVQAAEETARRAGKTAAEVGLDREVLGGARSKKILENFQNNFGESGESMLSRFLKKGEARPAMEELLAKKLKAEDVAHLLAEKEEEKEPGLPAQAGEKKLPSTGSLREKLRSSLKANSGEVIAKPSHENKSGSEELALQSLSPLDSSEFHETIAELSIFDVVSKKYREKWEQLLPYIKRKKQP